MSGLRSSSTTSRAVPDGSGLENLSFGAEGALYGTTGVGGTSTVGADDVLYDTTFEGGQPTTSNPSGWGTVFRITP
jgi:hypothetical protein